MTVDDVRAHVDRLGQTPFLLESLEVELDEGVGIGFSQLHRVRAAALDDLAQQLLAPRAPCVAACAGAHGACAARRARAHRGVGHESCLRTRGEAGRR